MRQDLGHGTTKRSSPPSLSVGENRSGKVRLPGVHIGDGVCLPAEAPRGRRVASRRRNVHASGLQPFGYPRPVTYRRRGLFCPAGRKAEVE